MPSRTDIALRDIADEDLDLAIDAAINKELAERSLKEFILQAWAEVLEPKTTFVDTWHIDAICEHLEAVTNGQITRLLINIPPRTMKSIATSVAWPAWMWINKPETRFLCASYANELSVRDSVKCRKTIQSPWYQDNWKDRFVFASDQNAKMRFDNDKTGYRIATSVDGLGTGEGGNVIIVDDPHNVKQAFSAAKREAVIVWWDQTMSTRLNDEKTGAIVIIMQRVHESDLSGHALASDIGYEHLCLPMEYEGENRCKTVLEFRDPRTEINELLCPERIDELAVRRKKKQLGTYGTAGQYQQRPAPLEGGLVNIDWYQRYRTLLTKSMWKRVIQFWDTASQPDEITNAPWVCGTWIETTDNRLIIADVYRRWMNYPTGKRIIKSHAAKWSPHAIVLENKSTGQTLLQTLPLVENFNFTLIPFEPEGDKLTRLSVESPAIEAGRVWLPEEAEWLADYEKELAIFPNSTTKDQADMTSMALKYFREGNADFWSTMEEAMSGVTSR